MRSTHHDASQYLDEDCTTAQHYEQRKLALQHEGYIFKRFIPLEFLEIDLLRAERVDGELFQRRMQGSFRNLLEEMTWIYREQKKCSILRLPAFSEGRRLSSMVALFYKDNEHVAASDGKQ